MELLWKGVLKNFNKTKNASNYDELTKLHNSTSFREQIRLHCEEAKVKGTTFALMVLDIDGFKYINDALGYQIGDTLITEIAQRLNSFLGATRIIFRYSGDQFVILVPGLSTIEEYESISNNIVALFSAPFKIESYELNVTASMGISIYPEDGQEPRFLKTHADRALLQAKASGKNRYQFYSSNMNIQNFKQFELRNDLRNAIKEHQLRVYYQPQVNLNTNEILGVEALIRWEHPTWGLVPPSEFIYLAEETGFIVDIGTWLLRKVCQTYKQWLNEGLTPIKVSVNYSSLQFVRKNIVENINTVLNEFQLEPHFLIIEITESVVMENKEQAITNIQNLQALGIQVALDDFGSGYSSLQYLNSFNIDILKLDKSFIKNVHSDKACDIIARTVINLTKELGIKLIVEGIESLDQLFYVQKLNCHIGQGFLYSKPLPLHEFEKLLIKKECKPLQIATSVEYSKKKSMYMDTLYGEEMLKEIYTTMV